MSGIIEIDGIKIGNNQKAYLIAEIGLNHNKDLNLTKKMILSAKENGADAVKFQTYFSNKLLLETSPVFSLFKNLELSKDDFIQIKKYCEEIGITFFSTPFCYESVDLLKELDVPCYKIASMDLNYYDFIKYIAQIGKPIILSTGMGRFSEIDRAVEVIEKTGNKNIIILHCVSKYPPLPGEMQLKIIEKLKNIYPLYPIGFSDHSPDNTMGIVARTLGACVFEKHFTLDKNLSGPDHQISCEPSDFLDLRNKINDVDDSLNDQSTDRLDFEIAKHARRSLFASKDIKKGEILDKDMIDIVRPGDGIAPEFLEVFIGKESKNDIKKGEKLKFSNI
jgi:N-acetylneuraminate synthase/N,N'-diacetyllegionaminate synthase